MKTNRRAIGALETLVAFLALAVLGFAGYNVCRTGCPLGCRDAAPHAPAAGHTATP